jgi:Glycosyl hydrolases family 28
MTIIHRKMTTLVLSTALSGVAGAVNVSVITYGAVGDGVTNDRPAIQNAIAYVNANGGGTATIPYRGSCSNTNGVCNTFLSGNLILESNVTLAISTNTSLTQSQAAADYSYTPVMGHSATSALWDTANFLNLPFISAASGATNLGVDGGGTIQMTTAPGGNANTIQVGPIGFYNVSNFTIENISILGSHVFNISLFNTSNGTVSGVTINTAHSGEFNDDGMSIQNSQSLAITGNTINTDDDGLYIWSSYNDPRGNTSGGLTNRWWSSANPQPSTNIEIANNSIASLGGMLIPWGAGAANPAQVEIAGINIHNNSFTANSYTSYAVHCWCDDPFHGEPYISPADIGVPEEMDASPVRDLTFANNTYIGDVSLPWDVGTNVVTDFPSPLMGGASAETVMNGGFEVGEAAYWSSVGTRGSDVGANNASVGQDGAWYGYIQYFSQGYTALYQGVRLDAGQTYTLKALLQSSGRSFRLFVYDTCTSASQTTNFSNTSWQAVSLVFEADSTCGDYHVGIDNFNGYSSGDWARIDDMSITSHVDSQNPMVSYSHGAGDVWIRYATTGDYDGDHKTSSTTGEYFLIPFVGTQATLLAYTYSGLGSGDISVDGGSVTNVSWSTSAHTTQDAVYTTPLLTYGLHQLKVAVHTNNYIDFDALNVTP